MNNRAGSRDRSRDSVELAQRGVEAETAPAGDNLTVSYERFMSTASLSETICVPLRSSAAKMNVLVGAKLKRKIH
jgi:hypothetical protein